MRPETVEQLVAYIRDNAADIFVREQLEGAWGSYALTELPVATVLRLVAKWVSDGAVPVVLEPNDAESIF